MMIEAQYRTFFVFGIGEERAALLQLLQFAEETRLLLHTSIFLESSALSAKPCHILDICKGCCSPLINKCNVFTVRQRLLYQGIIYFGNIFHRAVLWIFIFSKDISGAARFPPNMK
jgi:hypothetical protein